MPVTVRSKMCRNRSVTRRFRMGLSDDGSITHHALSALSELGQCTRLTRPLSVRFTFEPGRSVRIRQIDQAPMTWQREPQHGPALLIRRRHRACGLTMGRVFFLCSTRPQAAADYPEERAR